MVGSQTNNNKKIQEAIDAINYKFSVIINEVGHVHPYYDDGEEQKIGVNIKNANAEDSAKIFQAVKEYIEKHPTEFVLDSYVYHKSKEDGTWWSPWTNKQDDRWAVDLDIGYDAKTNKGGRSGCKVLTPEIYHQKGGKIHPNALTEDQYNELWRLLPDDVACKVKGCHNNYCYRNAKGNRYESGGHDKYRPSWNRKVIDGMCNFHYDFVNKGKQKEERIDDANALNLGIDEYNQMVREYNESMRNNSTIQKYDGLRKDFFGCSSAEDTYSPNQKYKNGDPQLFARIWEADQESLKMAGRNGGWVGGGIIGGPNAEKTILSSVDSNAKKAVQINNDNIEELNNYLIAEKEKLIKLMEELKQKVETGSSEQSNSNWQEETNLNEKSEAMEVEKNDPTEDAPEKLNPEESKSSPKDVSQAVINAKNEAKLKISKWESEFSQPFSIKRQGKIYKWQDFLENNLNSVDGINKFVNRAETYFIKQGKARIEKLINSPLPETRKEVKKELTGMKAKIANGKAKIAKIFKNWKTKNKVSPAAQSAGSWEEYVDNENDTTNLANFERDMRQELSKEIMSGTTNENTEKDNDKSIAPLVLVLGIGGVVILASLIGVVVLRQRRIKNKSRK